MALRDSNIIPSILIFLHAQISIDDSDLRLILSGPGGSCWACLESKEIVHDSYPPFDRINQLLLQGIQKLDALNISERVLSSSLSLALCGLQNQSNSRILVISSQIDIPSEYIPVMNCIFAAQKSNIPIDVLRFSKENSLFLSQASYLTSGVYYQTIDQRELLQILLTTFIVPTNLRSDLILPTQNITDLRPLCSCHKNTIEIGHVCTICLSIYCSKFKSCSSCGTIYD